MRTCPCCKNKSLDCKQMRPQEGGFCSRCDIWIVPISSLGPMLKVTKEYHHRHIMFHKKGQRLFTWKDLQKMSALEYVDLVENYT